MTRVIVILSSRVIVILSFMLLLSGCVATVSEAINQGGVKLGAEGIRAEFSGKVFSGKFVQGYVASHQFAFGADGESLSLDGNDGGRWYPDSEGHLCLDWPKSLGWRGKGYCFTALKEGKGYGLYDRTIDQLRLRFTETQ